MNNLLFARTCRLSVAGFVMIVTGGCALFSKPAAPPAFYSLDNARSERHTAARVPALPPSSLPSAAPTLVINPPRAAAGFDSQRIIYTRDAHKLDYFAHSEWIDTPARMLTPLIVAAIENSNAFRAVVQTPSAATGELRLDTEILRLQQNFGESPSRVRFTLRATMVDNATRRVLAWREFDEIVAAAREDPYGGVVAANRAVQAVLEKLADFCTEVAAQWQPIAVDVPKRAQGNVPVR